MKSRITILVVNSTVMLQIHTNDVQSAKKNQSNSSYELTVYELPIASVTHVNITAHYEGKLRWPITVAHCCGPLLWPITVTHYCDPLL